MTRSVGTAAVAAEEPPGIPAADEEVPDDIGAELPDNAGTSIVPV
jgi:hypothetical protein